MTKSGNWSFPIRIKNDWFLTRNNKENALHQSFRFYGGRFAF